MNDYYFKFKPLSFTPDGKLDEQSKKQVINPIVDSYYYLPTREKLNDPNEGVLQSQINIYNIEYYNYLLSHENANKLTEGTSGPLDDIRNTSNISGIFSLSGNVTDELLWAHYGASHRGIAIEYDLDLLKRFSSENNYYHFNVKYSEKPPEINIQILSNNNELEKLRNILRSKSSRWSYEEEFRIILENINGKIPHDYRAVKSITFGLKVPNDVREA